MILLTTRNNPATKILDIPVKNDYIFMNLAQIRTSFLICSPNFYIYSMNDIETTKFIDYRTVTIILLVIILSFLVGFLIFDVFTSVSVGYKLFVGAALLLTIAILANRKLSSRILTITNELTESGVLLKTKAYRQQIDSKTQELTLLNRELKRHIYELHNLFQISLDLTAIRELEQLINSYLNTVIGQLRIKNAVLYLVDTHNKRTLHVSKAKGLTEEEAEKLTFETTDNIVETVFQKRQPIVIADELTSLKEIEYFRHYDSEVITPLIHSHKLIGMMVSGSKINGEPYTQTDLEMLTLISNIVAVAIANAQLYHRLKEQSITDELTGLYNYRYFRIRLRDEVSRARRSARPVSLVILDVDHFKNYNDTLGHPAGDQVLKQIAKILTNSVRDTDVVARYGGEEFCIILPEVDEKGTKIFCERLRQNVEEYPFFKEEIQPNNCLTISLGAATYPNDAKITKELLIKADAALYYAKNLGRNRVCLYTERNMISPKLIQSQMIR